MKITEKVSTRIELEAGDTVEDLYATIGKFRSQAGVSAHGGHLYVEGTKVT